MKIALETLGCKLNRAETESLTRQLAEAGHNLVASVAEADVYILNTCTVTQTADAKSRHLLRLAHRRNKRALLVATGCYAQRAGGEMEKLDGVHLVIGNDNKSALFGLLNDSSCLESGEIQASAGDDGISRTRAFVKIQDGCNKFCSYCIVPFVRGREKSVPADRVVGEVKQRVEDGVKEAVLTGTEVGAYEDSGVDLTRLLERVLTETEVIRLRLSSLQPQEISPALVELWRDERLCPHFHLSLQSGSDSVLGRMRRSYLSGDYEKALTLIRSHVPDAAITTDIIAGFPGETHEEFEESVEFCRRMEFARIHVFPYSPRQGTKAANTQRQVNGKVKSQRTQALLAVGEESAARFMRRFSGRVMPVLWEQEQRGISSGYTGNYIKVSTRSGDDLCNRVLAAQLGYIGGEGMWGEVLDLSG